MGRARLGDVYRATPARGFFKAHRDLFLELRAGKVPFARVAEAIRPKVERRAHFLLKQWRATQDLLAFEDLVQEMTLEVWRAVDRWDPARSEDIARYVDVQVLQYANRELRRAAGWPDPRRGRLATRVGGDISEMVTQRERADSLSFEVSSSMVEAADQEDAVDRARRASRVLARLPLGLMRHVVGLVLEGESLERAAGRIYEDPALRVEYQFETLADVQRAVRTAASRATSMLAT